MKYRVIYRRDAEGLWIAEVPGVRGCHTNGRTLEEARTRIRELLKIFFPNEENISVEDDYGDSLTATPKSTIVCPACGQPDVVIEKRLDGRVVKYCPACGLRWSEDDIDAPAP
jgi:predicted RNase H-like HicB family nuclease